MFSNIFTIVVVYLCPGDDHEYSENITMANISHSTVACTIRLCRHGLQYHSMLFCNIKVDWCIYMFETIIRLKLSFCH